MYIGEIEVMPPAKEWLSAKYARVAARYPDHVALKRGGRRDWSGYAEAIMAETQDSERHTWPGDYVLVPVAALPRIMERLGDNAARVTVRALRAPEPQVPPGGPSGRYEVEAFDWRVNGGPLGYGRRRRRADQDA